MQIKEELLIFFAIVYLIYYIKFCSTDYSRMSHLNQPEMPVIKRGKRKLLKLGKHILETVVPEVIFKVC